LPSDRDVDELEWGLALPARTLSASGQASTGRAPAPYPLEICEICSWAPQRLT